MLLCAPLHALACWEEAAQRCGLAAVLLYAVPRAESDLNPRAVNRSHLQRTGSCDIGLMQIDSSHLRTLARPGVRPLPLVLTRHHPLPNRHAPAPRRRRRFG